ncbi:hypothetical protein LCGC14_2278150 [marine sediment metagenome]|uniref:Uncharacterized protein n=1 Tax=marine sediment metagenome TaxID=412755 RepID=A0A0F9CUW7_9ZZZZ
MLWFRNFIRKIRGRPLITSMYFDKNEHQHTDGAWESIYSHNQEAILIVIENKRNNKDYNKVTCHAKISNDSMLIHVVPEILDKISKRGP